MMDSSRLEKAETIFQRLVALPTDRRSSVLSELCGGDGELRALVDRLLVHDDSGMRGFLDAPIIADSASPMRPEAPLPQRFGNFELLRRISEGGMGVVYEARQENPRRIVAVKVIRGGRHVDDYTVRLFQRETQALARLRHPCIGAIYEAGRTDEGQHFFAMELVQGRPLMEHVREMRMGPRDRLELFRKISDAIHYAHQRGVMHRDLKPSNILVDIDGNPKVLDFGLARITDLELDIALPATVTGRIQGTLSYMSPEQARGDRNEIDIRSDVYSLGVMLFELLTDRLPYDVMGLPLPEAVRIICTQPPRKSDALKGDLETITLRALEKEPQRRYASAVALGEDVQRYLTNQPILARPASAAYQLRKLIARHKVGFSFSASLLALIIGSGIWMAVLYGQQHRERLRAEEGERRAEAEANRANQETKKAVEERNKTEQFAQFMEKTLEGVGPSVARGRDTKMLKEMMDAAAKRIDEGELKAIPDAELRLRETIGGIYIFMADYDSAGRMIGPMVDLAQRTHGAESADYARALENDAALLQPLGRVAEALPKAEEALAISRRLFPGDHPRIAACLDRLGMLLKSLGRFAEAVSNFEESLAMRRRLYPDDNLVVAQTLDNLAQALVATSSPKDALPKSEEALGMYRRLFSGDQPNLALTLNTIGAILLSQGRPAEALPKFEEALAMNRRLFPGDHPYVGAGLTYVGRTLIDIGHSAEALPKFEESLAIHRRLFPGDHPHVANSLSHLASGYLYMSRYDEALSSHEEALAMRQRLYPGDHPDVARALSSIGTVLQFMGRFDEALSKHEEALAIYQRLFPKDHPDVATNLSFTASDLQAGGRSTEALPKHEQALAIFQRLFPGDNPYVAKALNNLSFGLQSVGRLTEALDRCEEALAMMRRVHPPTHPDLRAAEIRRGSILVDLNRLADAEAVLAPAWQNVADRSDVRKKSKQQCLEAMVKLYEARDAAEPGNGYDAKAAEFRSRLESFRP